jgi:2-oxoglutarate ferredoxin oxidoreductase subunit beta
VTETALYTRPKSLLEMPMFYCPGCGHGIVHKLIAELIDEFDLRERMIAVAPVGCSVTAYDYLDVDFSESAHGRAPAVATGIKRSRPDCFVLAYQGDGDLASIGTAEIIHAANRGENITTVFVNNAIYGMTGGQMAPTTLIGQKATTCPDGRSPEAGMGYPIRVCELLQSLGGVTYLARTSVHTPANVIKTKKALKKGFETQIRKEGFSLIEVISPCPVNWGLSPLDALEFVEKRMLPYYPLGEFKNKGAAEAVEAA